MSTIGLQEPDTNIWIEIGATSCTYAISGISQFLLYTIPLISIPIGRYYLDNKLSNITILTQIPVETKPSDCSNG